MSSKAAGYAQSTPVLANTAQTTRALSTFTLYNKRGNLWCLLYTHRRGPDSSQLSTPPSHLVVQGRLDLDKVAGLTIIKGGDRFAFTATLWSKTAAIHPPATHQASGRSHQVTFMACVMLEVSLVDQDVPFWPQTWETLNFCRSFIQQCAPGTPHLRQPTAQGGSSQEPQAQTAVCKPVEHLKIKGFSPHPECLILSSL